MWWRSKPSVQCIDGSVLDVCRKALAIATAATVFLPISVAQAPYNGGSSHTQSSAISSLSSTTAIPKLEIYGAGSAEMINIIERTFPLFSEMPVANTTSGKPLVDYRPFGSESGWCRIRDPEVECSSDDIARNGFLEVDFTAGVVSRSQIGNEGDANVINELYPDIAIFPLMGVAMVPIVNLKQISTAATTNGQDELVVFDLEVLGDIFAGVITHWRDPRIISTLDDSGSFGLSAALPNQTIQVVVNSQADPKTGYLKNSLATYSQAFRNLNDTSDEPTWSGLSSLAQLSGWASVGSYVLLTPFTLAFVTLREAIAMGHTIARVRQEPNKPIIEANSRSITFTMLEKGLMFGDEEERRNRIEGDLSGSIGAYTWPFSMYLYIGLRTNQPNDRLREGATCEHIRVLFEYLFWLMESSTSQSVAVLDGYAILPETFGQFVIQQLRDVLFCSGQLVSNANTLPSLIVNNVYTRLLCPSWEYYIASVDVDQSTNAGLFAFTVDGCEDNYLLRGGLPDHSVSLSAPRSIQSNLPSEGMVKLPNYIYSYAIFANLDTVDGIGPEIVLTKSIVADIFRGQIIEWNDSRLVDLNPPLSNVAEKILVVKRCDRDDYSLAFEDILGFSPCDFNLTGEWRVSDYPRMDALITILPFSIGYIPHLEEPMVISRRTHKLAAFETVPASSSNGSTIVSILDLEKRRAALEACLTNTFDPTTISFALTESENPDCYPLAAILEIQTPSVYSELACQLSPIPLLAFNFVKQTTLGLAQSIFSRVTIISPYSARSQADRDPLVQATNAVQPLCGDELLFTPDETISEKSEFKTGSTFYTVVLYASVALTILFAVSSIHLYYHRHHQVVRAAGGPILIVFLFFLTCYIWSGFSFVLDPEEVSFICYLRPLLYLLGSAGTASVLMFRLLRVLLIFKKSILKRRTYNAKWIVKNVIFCVLATEIILIIFISINPPRVGRLTLHVSTETIQRFFSPYSVERISYIAVCKNDYGLLVAIIMDAIFLCINMVLSVPLWKVGEHYGDSRLIIFTNVQITIISGSNWILYFTWVDTKYKNSVTLSAIGNACNCLLMYCLFIFPRVFSSQRVVPLEYSSPRQSEKTALSHQSNRITITPYVPKIVEIDYS